MAAKHVFLRGFTLVELVVVMALVALLVTIGIPGFNNVIRDNRLITGTNELVASMALARSEAVKRGIPVTVCASTDGAACTASNWEQGWIVFTDQGVAGTVDGDDTMLRVQNALAGDINIADGGSTQIRYAADGFLASASVRHGASGLFTAAHDPDSLRTPLSLAVAAILPGRPAYAGRNDRNGGDEDSGSHTGGNSGNERLGTGNNGNGVGNTGTGNQGNDEQVGNAGGGRGAGAGGAGGAGGSGGGGGAVAQNTFTFCDSRSGENGRRVTITASGRIASQVIACQ